MRLEGSGYGCWSCGGRGQKWSSSGIAQARRERCGDRGSHILQRRVHDQGMTSWLAEGWGIRSTCLQMLRRMENESHTVSAMDRQCINFPSGRAWAVARKGPSRVRGTAVPPLEKWHHKNDTAINTRTQVEPARLYGKPFTILGPSLERSLAKYVHLAINEWEAFVHLPTNDVFVVPLMRC